MHARASNLSFKFDCSDVTRVSGQIFDEIKFIRLSQWQECTRSTILAGGISCAGQIFRRFELKNDSKVVLEFWFRGTPLSKETAEAFSEMLTEVRELDDSDLDEVEEVWRASVGGRMLGGVQFSKAKQTQMPYTIAAAEIGELHGRRMLAIWWEHNLFDRKFLSIFTDPEDGPGRLVHEVHFSAPTEDMHRHAGTIVDTLRSFQWSRALPPPIVSQPKLSA
jgi:hypothetical protein